MDAAVFSKTEMELNSVFKLERWDDQKVFERDLAGGDGWRVSSWGVLLGILKGYVGG
jgi:hypothetical protein